MAGSTNDNSRDAVKAVDAGRYWARDPEDLTCLITSRDK